MDIALSLYDVEKTYPDNWSLSNINFEVAMGEIIALLGPSGCGKSTTLSLIAGLETPDHGDIRWQGRSLHSVPPHQRGFGFMFQDLALFPHMNVFDNVAFGLRMSGWTDPQIKARVQEMLSLVGLPGFARRDVNRLSGGEQQRVALARAIAPSPRLLMLDEPLGALDRDLRQRLVGDLRNILTSMGQTAIYVTHDQEEAFILADRVVLMNAGRIVQIGTPQQLYHQPASVFAARFLGMVNLLPASAQTAGNKTLLQLPICETIIDRPFPPGATVLLRPDSVQLNGSAPCQLNGHLLRSSFRGSVCQVIIEVNGVELTFDFPSITPLPAVGQPLQISFDPQQALQILEN
jgi:ABC-type Fe3+/spermidine/putrescine transport system ATPase subunit